MLAKAYGAGWADVVRHGISSYVDVLRRLKDGRQYHSSRSLDTVDFDQGNFVLRIEIPLLWGTF